MRLHKGQFETKSSATNWNRKNISLAPWELADMLIQKEKNPNITVLVSDRDNPAREYTALLKLGKTVSRNYIHPITGKSFKCNPTDTSESLLIKFGYKTDIYTIISLKKAII